jgi:hypothetical protein
LVLLTNQAARLPSTARLANKKGNVARNMFTGIRGRDGHAFQERDDMLLWDGSKDPARTFHFFQCHDGSERIWGVVSVFLVSV